MIKKKLFNLYNKTMGKLLSTSRFSKSKIAQNRLKLVEFSKKYSIKATQDAFNVSRATIFRWRWYFKRIPGEA
jgi:hypothetical protein